MESEVYAWHRRELMGESREEPDIPEKAMNPTG
jgi:hypothetical protein